VLSGIQTSITAIYPMRSAQTKLSVIRVSLSNEFRDLGEHFEMSLYGAKSTKKNRTSQHRQTVDQDKPRRGHLLGSIWAKAFRECRRAERERVYQPIKIYVATAADSLIELLAEMRSADTDVDVDEPTGPVRVQLRAAELRLRCLN
jgi:hypothetical protein